MGGDSKKLEKEREAALRECEKLRAALKTLGYDDNAESGMLQVQTHSSCRNVHVHSLMFERLYRKGRIPKGR
jgi:hypothetical protein